MHYLLNVSKGMVVRWMKSAGKLSAEPDKGEEEEEFETEG